MIAALLKLVPFRDYLYAAIAIAAVVFYNVHVTKLEHGYAAKATAAIELADKNATDRTLRAAKDALDAKDASYKQALAAQDVQHAQDIQARATAYAADIARLRQLAAASDRNSNAGVGSPSGTSSGTGSVSGSAEGLGYVPAELGAELAGALRATRDQRDLCYAERDSLTGK